MQEPGRITWVAKGILRETGWVVSLSKQRIESIVRTLFYSSIKICTLPIAKTCRLFRAQRFLYPTVVRKPDAE